MDSHKVLVETMTIKECMAREIHNLRNMLRIVMKLSGFNEYSFAEIRDMCTNEAWRLWEGWNLNTTSEQTIENKEED